MVISVCKWYNVKKRTVTSEESRKGRGHMNKLEDMGAVAAIAGIAYAVYKFFTPDYLEDFEEDFEDDFDDDFFSDDDEV